MDNHNKEGKSSHTGTILIVDDNPNNRDMCRIYLEIEGYTIYSAENGQQGIEKARNIKPDLMLLDIMMPVMDGYQALRRLKADPALCNLPVLVLTVKSDTNDVVEALHLGANDYLKKPFDADELIARVHTLVTLKQTQDSLHRLTDDLRRYKGNLESELEKRTLDAKAYQDKIFQNQKLDALGTLSAGIAHDFKNILFLITGYIEMTLMNVMHDPESVKNLQHALTAAKRAKNLIKDILVFSRRENSEQKPTNIQHIIIDVLKMIRSSNPPSTRIESDIDMACGAIMCSPARIHQMIVNLCANAYHAMNETGGTLKIALKEICLDAETIAGQLDIPPGKYVRLSVSDTGRGISGDIMEKIFDPYFSTKGSSDGMGLGLSVVFGIVKSHNGDLTVDSKVDSGTTFQIYLPQIPSTFFSIDEGTGESACAAF